MGMFMDLDLTQIHFGIEIGTNHAPLKFATYRYALEDRFDT